MNNTELQARICGVRAADGGAHLLIEVEIRENGERRRETLTLLTARVEQMPQIGVLSPEALDGLPLHKMHCSVLAEEAIKGALKDYFDKNNIPYDEKDFPDCEHCAHCE